MQFSDYLEFGAVLLHVDFSYKKISSCLVVLGMLDTEVMPSPTLLDAVIA